MLKLDVAKQANEFMKTTLNILTLQSQIITPTTKVEIGECPDIDGMP